MKKVALLLTVLCGLSLGAFAQSGNGGGKWNIGIEPALPLGDLKSVYSFALGGSVKYELPVASSTFITFSADYQRFFIKSDLKDALNAIGINKSGIGIIPVKVGVKTYFDQGFFAEAQVGAGFSTEEGGKTSFVYAPGIGYTFTSGFEAGLKYQGYSSEGANNGVLALRLAYRF